MVGMSLLYSDGVYYEKSQVKGETQYKVVSPPLGATLPQNAVPADAATVTVAGTPYYYYGNVFYKVAPQGGTMGFVSVHEAGRSHHRRRAPRRRASRRRRAT